MDEHDRNAARLGFGENGRARGPADLVQHDEVHLATVEDLRGAFAGLPRLAGAPRHAARAKQRPRGEGVERDGREGRVEQGDHQPLVREARGILPELVGGRSEEPHVDEARFAENRLALADAARVGGEGNLDGREPVRVAQSAIELAEVRLDAASTRVMRLRVTKDGPAGQLTLLAGRVDAAPTPDGNHRRPLTRHRVSRAPSSRWVP